MDDGLGYCIGARQDKMAQLAQKRLSHKHSLRRPTRKDVMAKNSSGQIVEKMDQLQRAMSKDNFVKCLEKALDKTDPEYGKPQEGTRTAERGKKAHSHVHKEILELCEVIYKHGFEEIDEDDGEVTTIMMFGDLFRLYTRISDKVVGILLRAKKYGLVYFEPEMLFQGQHNDTPIFLAKPMSQIYQEFNANKGFVMPDKQC